MKIDQNVLYAPCPCQSGKKFKFCCWPKYRDRIDDGMSMSEITVMIRGDELDMSGVLANDEANGLFDRGYDLMKKGDIEQAVVFFSRARELDETLWTAWNNEATCFWEKCEIEKAYELQRKGIEKSPVENTFGCAAMAIYSYALGREDEAQEWVSRAMANKRPLEASVVVHVCKALAIFRRHRDILDYVDATGMADDPHVAFYRGTALANLREYGQAMLPMRMACDGPNEMVARRYLDGLKYGYDPFSPYEGDWPYFSPCDFAPARWFGEDLAKGEDPFVRCRNFAAEAVVALVEDADYMPEEMLEAIKGQTGERMEKLRAGLEELAKARVKPQPAKVEPAMEDDDYNGDDEEERRRLPMRTRFDWEKDVDGLDKELLGELKQSLELIRDFEQDGMTSEFVRIENHLSQLESLRREHYLVEKNYLEMVWLHDPERALGTLQTFYAQHEDDAFVAALLVYWLAKSGQREKAFALMNRFRLPDERTAAAMLPDWMMACVPFLPEEVKTKLPEAHRRAKEIYDAIMSTWRSMNNPRRSNTRT